MALIDRLAEEDRKLDDNISKLHDQPKEIFAILIQKNELYLKYEKLADEWEKQQIQKRKRMNYLWVALYKTRLDLESDIAKIISRLDTLEKSVKEFHDQSPGRGKGT